MKMKYALLNAVLIFCGQLLFAQKNILGTTHLGGEGGYGTFYRHDVNSGAVSIDYALEGIPGNADQANSMVYAGNGVYYGLAAYMGTPYTSTWGEAFKYDMNTGEFETIAEFQYNGPFGGSPRFNPILHNNHLYFQTTTKIIKLNLTTYEKTTIADFQNDFPVMAMPRMDLIKMGDVLYYVGGDNWYSRNYIYKYDMVAETGSLIYESQTGNYFNAAYAEGNAIYIGAESHLGVFNTTTNEYAFLQLFINAATVGSVPISMTKHADNLYIQYSVGGAHNNGSLVQYNLTSNTFTSLYNYQYSPAQVTPYGGGGQIIYSDSKLVMLHRYDFANNDGNSVWFEYNLISDMVTITSMGVMTESGGYNLIYSNDLEAFVFLGRFGIFAWNEGNSELTQFVEFNKPLDFGFLGGSRVRHENMIYGFARTSNSEELSDQYIYAHNVEDNSLTLLDDLIALMDEENAWFTDLLAYKNGKLYGFVEYGSYGVGPRPIFNGDVEAHRAALADAQALEASRSVFRYLYSYDVVTGEFELLQEITNGYRWFQSLIEVDDVLYGNCAGGGTDQAGAIFSYDLSDNTFSVLYEYTEDYNPWQWAGNIIYHDGSLYGVQPFSEIVNTGVLYKYDLAQAAFSVLHAVVPTDDGVYPCVLEISGEIIYVVSSEDENGEGGVVWSYDLSDDSVNVLATLDRDIHGSYAYQNPIVFEGKLYFQTRNHGQYNRGAVVAMDLDDNTLSVILDHGPTYGGIDYYSGTNLIAIDYCEFETYDVTLSNGVLNVDANNATYAWVNCNDESVVLATTQSFTPTVSGDYKVFVTNGDCEFESNCVQVSVSGVGLSSEEQVLFVLYPNPTHESVTLTGLAAESTITIVDVMGRTVETIRTSQETLTINTSNYAQGLYFVEVSSVKGSSAQRLIKK
jgi:hypothetical protein